MKIALIGLPGSGKTSKALILSGALGLPVIREDVQSPHLLSTYKEKASPYQLHHELLNLWSNLPDRYIADSCVLLDHQYAKLRRDQGVLTPREFQKLKKAKGKVKQPDIYLYAKIDPSVALMRIQKRGRGFEQGAFSLEYLTNLQSLIERALVKQRKPFLTLTAKDGRGLIEEFSARWRA